MTFGSFDSELVEATYDDMDADLPPGVDRVSVYAIGGGTVGRHYNQYAYRVTFTHGTEEKGTDLRSGVAIDHRRAAELAAFFVSKES